MVSEFVRLKANNSFDGSLHLEELALLQQKSRRSPWVGSLLTWVQSCHWCQIMLFGLVDGPSGSALTPAVINAAVSEPPKFFLQESA
jgi:hypothetical protein